MSHSLHRTRGPASIRFPSEWSRALSNRSEGLFKKANTLFHMERPKIAVLVSSGAQSHGYLSHGPEDWPELHQLVISHGIVLATPDDLDTVSQRYASRPQSVTSTSSSTTLFNEMEQDSIMQLLATLEEEPETVSGVSASILGTEQNPLPQVWSLPSTPERMLKPLETKAPVAQMSTGLISDSNPNPKLGEATENLMPSPPSRHSATPDYARAILTPRTMDARVNKRRTGAANGKGTRGPTTRSRGVRSSKRRC